MYVFKYSCMCTVRVYVSVRIYKHAYMHTDLSVGVCAYEVFCSSGWLAGWLAGSLPVIVDAKYIFSAISCV